VERNTCKMSIFLCAVEYPGPAEHPGGSHREECRVRGSETKGETVASSRVFVIKNWKKFTADKKKLFFFGSKLDNLLFPGSL
jgi:hypothetical protein